MRQGARPSARVLYFQRGSNVSMLLSRFVFVVELRVSKVEDKVALARGRRINLSTENKLSGVLSRVLAVCNKTGQS